LSTDFTSRTQTHAASREERAPEDTPTIPLPRCDSAQAAYSALEVRRQYLWLRGSSKLLLSFCPCMCKSRLGGAFLLRASPKALGATSPTQAQLSQQRQQSSLPPQRRNHTARPVYNLRGLTQRKVSSGWSRFLLLPAPNSLERRTFLTPEHASWLRHRLWGEDK